MSLKLRTDLLIFSVSAMRSLNNHIFLESGNGSEYPRKVEEVVSKFGLENVSASEVSRIAKELDEKVKEFLDRQIEGPYLIFL